MDALPTEVLTHILSFFKGEDILKLQFLNSRCKRLWKKRRNTFQYPKYGLAVENDDHIPMYEGEKVSTSKSFNIHLMGQWSCTIDYSNPESVKIVPVHKERRDGYYHAFFADPKRSFSKFFNTYTAGKTTLSHPLADTKCFAAMTSAVKESSASIREIRFLFDTPQFREASEFLDAVGHHGEKGKDFPRMSFGSMHCDFAKWWREYGILNEIASNYRKSLLSCTFPEVPIFMAKGWIDNPFSKFNFGFVIYCNRSLPTPFEWDDMDPRFQITVTHGNYFRMYNWGNEESSVELRDKLTGKALIFMKKNGPRVKYCDRWKYTVEYYIQPVE